MEQIAVFKKEMQDVRVFNISGEPWFSVADVCDYFKVTNRNRVMQQIDDDEKGGTQMDTPGGKQTISIVSEAGLYSLLFALQPQKARGVSDEYIESRITELRAFKRWITHEVIPTIRKTGGYVANDDLFLRTYLPNVDEATREMFRSTLSTVRALNARIEQDRPKVLFADAVATSKTSILIGDLAKIIRQNGVDIGQKRLFEWMRDNGYLIKQKGTSWNMPTQRAMEAGWFEVKETAIAKPDGSTLVSRTTKITGSGQTYFVNKFLAKGA